MGYSGRVPREEPQMQPDDFKTRLRKATLRASEELDLLSKEIEVLREIDFEKVQPPAQDRATYDELIRTVQEATRNNEKAAILRANIEKLGQDAVQLAQRMAADRLL